MNPSVCAIWLVGLLATLPHYRCSAQQRSHIGRASCASATCHGGIVGQGPMWNQSLSRWEAEDGYHSSAGNVLKNQLSMKIVAGLLGSQQDDPTFPTRFVETLRERCVSCHAPRAVHTSGSQDDWQELLADGVSCESCHGPAAQWLNVHTLKTWDKSQPAAAEAGMLDTESWLSRTDICLRCHVGSRRQDSLLRDMNHDMIAAGHPALLFDMSLFQLAMPAHWSMASARELAEDSPPSESASAARHFEVPTLAEHNAAQWRTVMAAAQLGAERMQDGENDRQIPWPEFADYDCTACHRKLELSSASLQRTAHDQPSWSPWYTSRVRNSVPDQELFLGIPGMRQRLESIASAARTQSEEAMSGGEGRAVQSSIWSENSQSVAQRYQAYADFSQLQLELLNARMTLPTDRFGELRLALEQLQPFVTLPHDSAFQRDPFNGDANDRGNRDWPQSVGKLLELRRLLAEEVRKP